MDNDLSGLRIGFLGGDIRDTFLIQGLIQKGAIVSTLGKPPVNVSVNVLEDPGRLIKENRVIIAPMSSTDEKGYIKATFSGHKVCLDEKLLQNFEPGQLFLIGVARTEVKRILNKFKINFVELAKRNDIAILNAIPTAEGVIQIAIENTPITLSGSRSIIFGMGRCGLTLALRLKALGSKVYGVTRSPENIAWGENLGVEMVNYDELVDILPRMNLIINTVPAMVLPEDRLCLLSKDCLIIDIASAPGGVDFEAAKKYRIKALLAPGLPGKVAPKTAGEILIKFVPGIIKEKIKN